MRATKSATSSSEKALSSDSIGTACRTLAKPRDGAAPTLRDRLSSVRRSGKRASIGVVALPQRVIVGVGDGRRVLLVVALVVRLDLGLQPRVLALGLARRHLVDGELGVPGRLGRFHGLLVILLIPVAGRACNPIEVPGSRPTLEAGWIPRLRSTLP